MRWRVAAETFVPERDPFITTETVCGLTPAHTATSRSVLPLLSLASGTGIAARLSSCEGNERLFSSLMDSIILLLRSVKRFFAKACTYPVRAAVPAHRPERMARMLLVSHR